MSTSALISWFFSLFSHFVFLFLYYFLLILRLMWHSGNKISAGWNLPEDWKMSCAVTGHPVWGEILFLGFSFCCFFFILWGGNVKACLLPSVWTCGCGTAWVLPVEPVGAGEMLLPSHSSITSEQSFLTPYQPGLWEEEVKWGGIYWFIAQRWFHFLLKAY